MVAIARLMFPDALIPSTTAIATLAVNGRREGILSGANVVMPNITTQSERRKYSIYDNKAISGGEAIEGLRKLESELNEIGYHLDFSRGDFQKRERL